MKLLVLFIHPIVLAISGALALPVDSVNEGLSIDELAIAASNDGNITLADAKGDLLKRES
ncbi:hypothetical protein ACLOAV_010355 [Pseudogymnoascus australis]